MIKDADYSKQCLFTHRVTNTTDPSMYHIPRGHAQQVLVCWRKHKGNIRHPCPPGAFVDVTHMLLDLKWTCIAIWLKIFPLQL